MAVLLGLGLRQLRGLSWISFLHAIFIGLALYPASLLVLAVAWAILLSALRLNRFAVNLVDAQVYLSSHLVKRLPGGVWYVAARVAAYGPGDASPIQTVGASAIEWFAVVTTALISFVAFGLFPYRVLGVQVAFAALSVGLLGGLVGFASGARARFRDEGSVPANRRARAMIGGVIGLCQLTALANGAAIVYLLVGASGNGIAPERMMASWSLAAAASAVVALIPFGAGLRDLTLVAILSTQIPAPSAVVVVAITRLLFVAGDLVWGTALLALVRRVRPGPRLLHGSRPRGLGEA